MIKDNLSKENLYELYINKKLTMTEISKLYNCAYSSINRLINLYDIKQRTNSETKKLKLQGKKFGEWTVIQELYSNKHGQVMWLCECKCGKRLKFAGHALTYGKTQCIQCANKINRITGRIPKTLFYKIKYGAKKRNLDCNISAEYIWELLLKQNWKCNLTGLDIIISDTTSDHRKGNSTLSLDRIDSTKGYIEGNVQWVHKHINLIKNNNDMKKFISLCNLIVTHKYCTIKSYNFVIGENIYKSYLHRIIKSSIKRNIQHDLSIKQISDLFIKQGGRCSLSGLNIILPSKTYIYDGNASLDRINSNKGYTIDNVQWVHKDINRFKLWFDEEYFLFLCQRVIENFSSV